MSQPIKPRDLGLVIQTSDVVLYDGTSLVNILLTADKSLNGVISAIDTAIGSSVQSDDLVTTKVIYNSSPSFSCITIPANSTLSEVIDLFGNKICDNTSAITNLKTSGVGYDGAAISNYTPTGSAGINSQLEGIDNEIGTINTTLASTLTLTEINTRINEITVGDFVYDGAVETSGGGSLDVTIDDGSGGSSTYYVDGVRISKPSEVVTLQATTDNYLDINSSGTYNVTAVAISAAAPPILGMRLYKFETNGSGVVSVTDLRQEYPITHSELATDAVETRNIKDLNVTGAKIEDIVAATTVSMANVTIDTKGRVTSMDSDFNLSGLADNDILQYDLGTSKWVNLPVVGSVLPSATQYETMFFNGSSWASTSALKVIGTKIGMSSTAAPEVDLALGESRDFGIELKRPDNVSALDVAGGSLPDDTFYYVVTSRDGRGETVVSDEVNATTSSVDGDSQVDITWDDVVGAVEYRVYKGTTAGVYTEYFTVSAPTNSYSDDGTAGTAGSPPSTTTAFAGAMISEEGTLLTRMLAAEVAALSSSAIGQAVFITDNDQLNINTSTGYKPVIAGADSGWADPTGTSTKTTFDTSTVTVSQLAERVKAIYDALKANGTLTA